MDQSLTRSEPLGMAMSPDQMLPEESLICETRRTTTGWEALKQAGSRTDTELTPSEAPAALGYSSWPSAD